MRTARYGFTSSKPRRTPSVSSGWRPMSPQAAAGRARHRGQPRSVAGFDGRPLAAPAHGDPAMGMSNTRGRTARLPRRSAMAAAAPRRRTGPARAPPRWGTRRRGGGSTVGGRGAGTRRGERQSVPVQARSLAKGSRSASRKPGRPRPWSTVAPRGVRARRPRRGGCVVSDATALARAAARRS